MQFNVVKKVQKSLPIQKKKRPKRQRGTGKKVKSGLEKSKP